MTSVDKASTGGPPPEVKKPEKKDNAEEVKKAQGGEGGGDNNDTKVEKPENAKPALDLESDATVANADVDEAPDAPSDAFKDNVVEDSGNNGTEVSNDSGNGDDMPKAEGNESGGNTTSGSEEPSGDAGLEATLSETETSDSTEAADSNSITTTNEVETTEPTSTVTIDKDELDDNQLEVDVTLDQDAIDNIETITVDGQEAQLLAEGEDVEVPDEGALVSINVRSEDAAEGDDPVQVYNAVVGQADLDDGELDINVAIGAEAPPATEEDDTLAVNVTVTRSEDMEEAPSNLPVETPVVVTPETDNADSTAPVASGSDEPDAVTEVVVSDDAPVVNDEAETVTSASGDDGNEGSNSTTTNVTNGGNSQTTVTVSSSSNSGSDNGSDADAGSGSDSGSGSGSSTNAGTFNSGNVGQQSGNGSGSGSSNNSGNNNSGGANSGGGNNNVNRSSGSGRSNNGSGSRTQVRSTAGGRMPTTFGGFSGARSGTPAALAQFLGNSLGVNLQGGAISNGFNGSFGALASRNFIGVSNSDIISAAFGNRTSPVGAGSFLNNTISPLRSVLTAGVADGFGLTAAGNNFFPGANLATQPVSGMEVLLAQLGLTVDQFQNLTPSLQAVVSQRLQALALTNGAGSFPGVAGAQPALGTFSTASLGQGAIGTSAITGSFDPNFAIGASTVPVPSNTVPNLGVIASGNLF